MLLQRQKHLLDDGLGRVRAVRHHHIQHRIFAKALVETVTSNYDIVARHYELKRALLGYDKLYDYDRYAPLPMPKI